MSGTNNHLLTQAAEPRCREVLDCHPCGGIASTPRVSTLQFRTTCANARVNDLSEEHVLPVMHRELDSDPLFTNV
jgi:hypothetical protein